jgi:hypothetical protein
MRKWAINLRLQPDFVLQELGQKIQLNGAERLDLY